MEEERTNTELEAEEVERKIIPIDPKLAAEVAATCNALGVFDPNDEVYLIDEFVIETVKDLIKYLRRDNESFEIRRLLGESNVLQTDLLPMLKSHSANVSLFEVLLRLLVNLTNPVLLLFHEEPPADKIAHKHFLEIIAYLQNYKEAFADRFVWKVINDRLVQLLAKDTLDRDEDSSLTVERILILIRNVLNVVDKDNHFANDTNTNAHDRVLNSLSESKVFDSLMMIAQSDNERVFYMHILEILSLIFREQNPERLAKFTLDKSVDEQIQEDTDLLIKFNKEQRSDDLNRKKSLSNRHSNFGGTLVLKDVKAISNKSLIVHKNLAKLDDLQLDRGKKMVKKAKKRDLIDDKQTTRESNASIYHILKELSIEFLKKAYNKLMYHVRGCFVRGRAQQHDESYFLWALRFFMEFNRHSRFYSEFVKETISTQVYYFVQTQIEQYLDTLKMEKKKTALWLKRLHLALQAYRELMTSINMMDCDPKPENRELAKSIKNEIFYIQDYRELILTLFLRSNEIQLSYSFLSDLIEAQFIFLRMLEKYCKEEKASIRVEKIKTVHLKRKKTINHDQNDATIPIEKMVDEFPISEDHWNECSKSLENLLMSWMSTESSETVVPFDASSDLPIDDQKNIAMRRIQMAIGKREFEKVVSLLKASRNIWFDCTDFGTNESSIEDEMSILKNIFFDKSLASLKDNNRSTATNVNGNEGNRDSESFIDGTSEYSDNEAEESEPKREYVAVETTFDFEDFIKRFVNSKVIKICGLCLREFERNSKLTNFSLVKLMHRIAWDCRMPAMFFQASIFRSFQRLIPLKHFYPELHKFSTFIIKRFFEVAKSNPKIYIEILFWKTSQEAYDIEEGYGSFKQTIKEKKSWSDAEESELKVLCEEFRKNEIDEDLVDWIQNNLINAKKTRRAIIIQLKKMNLLGHYKRKSNRNKRNRSLSKRRTSVSPPSNRSSSENNLSSGTESDGEIDWNRLRSLNSSKNAYTTEEKESSVSEIVRPTEKNGSDINDDHDRNKIINVDVASDAIQVDLNDTPDENNAYINNSVSIKTANSLEDFSNKDENSQSEDAPIEINRSRSRRLSQKTKKMMSVQEDTESENEQNNSKDSDDGSNPVLKKAKRSAVARIESDDDD